MTQNKFVKSSLVYLSDFVDFNIGHKPEKTDEIELRRVFNSRSYALIDSPARSSIKFEPAQFLLELKTVLAHYTLIIFDKSWRKLSQAFRRFSLIFMQLHQAEFRLCKKKRCF